LSREASAAATTPKPATVDLVPAIELKVAQQHLEKTLTDMQETQAELASLRTKMKDTHPSVEKLRTKLGALEQEAARLRAQIQQIAPGQ
jgi:septal ring factor EnvC (AmiA/AmiB activator)